ncbi:hypothetical protein [Bradyrhizobium sp. 192]|uniref:hypothetical protein n=1 Tax=Bradyrhizobium sp. 192 TaxID=2782660 RepID=UPI001FFF08C3|nr:hypothetical protein [Bradyrhizobium sp. 192]
MRSNYHIAVFKPADDGIEPWLNLSNAAKLLKIAPKTLRLAAEAGEIEAFHPLSDGACSDARLYYLRQVSAFASGPQGIGTSGR